MDVSAAERGAELVRRHHAAPFQARRLGDAEAGEERPAPVGGDPEHLEPGVRNRGDPPRRREQVEPLGLRVGRVGDGEPLARSFGSGRGDRERDDDARRAAVRERRLRGSAHGQHEPRAGQATPLERVLSSVAAPGPVEHRRRIEADGVRRAAERGHQRRGGRRHHDRARVVARERGRRGAARGDRLHEVDRGIEPLQPPRGAHPDAHDLHARPRRPRHLGERLVGRTKPAGGAQRQQQKVGPRHPGASSEAGAVVICARSSSRARRRRRWRCRSAPR